MKNIKTDEGWFFEIEYKPYIAENLGQFGCAIFDKITDEQADLLLSRLRATTYEDVFLFPIKVYNDLTNSMRVYHAFANIGSMTPFGYFDLMRLECGQVHLEKFYACNYQTDKIYAMSPATICEWGPLTSLKDLLGLDENNHIVFRRLKWCSPRGFGRYFQGPNVFKNAADEEYNRIYGRYLYQCSPLKLERDVFYSLGECYDNFDPDTHSLVFTKHTDLEFDIVDPELSIVASNLKARNLTVKNVTAREELFCSALKCESLVADKVYAESIECKNLQANCLHIDFKGGISLGEFAEK